MDHTEVSLVLDNEAIYEVCQKWLDVRRPSYENLNRLITKTISSMTAALRFGGELNVDLNEFQTNLVPFPRLHFMITSMAPVSTSQKIKTATVDVRSITESCFTPSNFFTKFCIYISTTHSIENLCFALLCFLCDLKGLLILMLRKINIWQFQ